ncbi:MAG: DUF6110 family protein [Gracilibacteraceae bacterium]|jgi:hypothetical protein|nr:DUF6110 family protein [Gracilibacteraceae bacterium]
MGLIKLLIHPRVLSFIGGGAATILGGKLLKSRQARQAAVQVMAGGLKLQDSIMTAFESIKEEAQDIYAEAKQSAAAEAWDEDADEAEQSAGTNEQE